MGEGFAEVGVLGEVDGGCSLGDLLGQGQEGLVQSQGFSAAEGDIAGSDDLVFQLGRQQADPAGVFYIQKRAESTGQNDPVDFLQ